MGKSQRVPVNGNATQPVEARGTRGKCWSSSFAEQDANWVAM